MKKHVASAKRYTLIVVIGAAMLLSAPFAFAAPSLIHYPGCVAGAGYISWSLIGYDSSYRWTGLELQNSEPQVLKQMVAAICKSGSPSDDVVAVLLDASHNVLATSTNSVPAASIQACPPSVPTLFSFEFSNYSLVASTTYKYALGRTGSMSTSDNFSLAGRSCTDPFGLNVEGYPVNSQLFGGSGFLWVVGSDFTSTSSGDSIEGMASTTAEIANLNFAFAILFFTVAFVFGFIMFRTRI